MTTFLGWLNKKSSSSHVCPIVFAPKPVIQLPDIDKNIPYKVHRNLTLFIVLKLSREPQSPFGFPVTKGYTQKWLHDLLQVSFPYYHFKILIFVMDLDYSFLERIRYFLTLHQSEIIIEFICKRVDLKR